MTSAELDEPRVLAESLAAFRLPDRAERFVLPWPAPAMLGAFISFASLEDWRAFVLQLDLDPRIPLVVRAKFARALTILYLAWIDFDLIKVAEMLAITTLELALRDRHPGVGKLPAFGTQLKLLVDREGLTDADIPMIMRCGGTAVGRITGASKPSLREIRNGLAHGDPFDGLPHAGLIELVRDLITFAYRAYLAEADLHGVLPLPLGAPSR